MNQAGEQNKPSKREPTTIDVIIPGKPLPQQRHRTVRRGKFISTYDPMAQTKQDVLLQVQGQLRGWVSATTTLSIALTFNMPIPKSYSKKQQLLLPGTPHTKKPDIDNLIKFVLDTFNGVLYKDDSLISTLVAKKVYSYEPKTIIKLTNEEQ